MRNNVFTKLFEKLFFLLQINDLPLELLQQIFCHAGAFSDSVLSSITSVSTTWQSVTESSAFRHQLSKVWTDGK